MHFTLMHCFVCPPEQVHCRHLSPVITVNDCPFLTKLPEKSRHDDRLLPAKQNENTVKGTVGVKSLNQAEKSTPN